MVKGLRVDIIKSFFSILSSGGHFSIFGRGLHKKHFCKIIRKLVHWLRRKYYLKVVFLLFFLALAAILFIVVERFLPILVGSHLGIIPVKSESKWPKCLRGDSLKANYLRCTIFSSDRKFVNRSQTVLTVLIEGQLSNIPMRTKCNRPRGIGGDGVLRIFLFLDLATILFIGAERLYLFW